MCPKTGLSSFASSLDRTERAGLGAYTGTGFTSIAPRRGVVGLEEDCVTVSEMVSRFGINNL